jgi:hypothetical protein
MSRGKQAQMALFWAHIEISPHILSELDDFEGLRQDFIN